MFDIQLSYDVDQALDPEEWDGNFYAILLYRAMEHYVVVTTYHKDKWSY